MRHHCQHQTGLWARIKDLEQRFTHHNVKLFSGGVFFNTGHRDEPKLKSLYAKAIGKHLVAGENLALRGVLRGRPVMRETRIHSKRAKHGLLKHRYTVQHIIVDLLALDDQQAGVEAMVMCVAPTEGVTIRKRDLSDAIKKVTCRSWRLASLSRWLTPTPAGAVLSGRQVYQPALFCLPSRRWKKRRSGSIRSDSLATIRLDWCVGWVTLAPPVAVSASCHRG